MRGPTIVSVAVLVSGMLFARPGVATQDMPAMRQRASQHLAMVEQALRLADAMNFFWTAFGEAQKSRDRLTQVLAMPTASRATALRAKALVDAALLAFRQGDQATARALNEESFAIGQPLGDKAAMASALVNLSRVALRDHDYGAVRRYAQQGMKLRRGHEQARDRTRSR